MERNLDAEAAVIANDLDSLMHRIEALQAHPEYTIALVKVQEAKRAMIYGREDLHKENTRKRLANV